MKARRTRALPLALAVVGLAAVTFVTAPPADAAAFTRSAWWSRLNDNGADLSAASPKPSAGGIAVAAGPQGATAIGAVHYELAADETSPVLKLRVEASSVNSSADGIVVLACLAGAGWSAGAAQTWASAPPAACSTSAGGGSVAGQRSADGSTWTFPVGPLQLATVVDVLLVPAAAAGAAAPPFQLNFAPVDASALTVDRRSGADPPAPPPPPQLADTTSPPVFEQFPEATFPPPPGFGESFTPAASADATFSPLLPAESQGITATAPVIQIRSQPRVDRILRRSAPGWLRLLAVVQVGAALAFGWSLLRRRDEEGEPDGPRGLGPFVRLRHGEVPPL